MDKALYDNHGRIINYVRIAVTDRCNLRCFYCMPEEGIDFLHKSALLSYEELLRILRLLASMGISKVRLTGGEPFVRRGLMGFIEKIAAIEGISKIALTTNGTLTADLVKDFKALKISSVNLSLDSLDPARFAQITRRDDHAAVLRTLYALIEAGIETKINCVVMQGHNEADILPLAAFTKEQPVNVRFIEEMPFNGSGAHPRDWAWDHLRILQQLQTHFPSIKALKEEPNATAKNYQIEGHLGSVGIIAAFSRTFCGTCNRIRITPQGLLKTCLYDSGTFNVRDLLRAGATDGQLRDAFLQALSNRAKDGREAEANRFAGAGVSESMTTIGG
jgi:molybdenum cofactor biosynthesis protein A